MRILQSCMVVVDRFLGVMDAEHYLFNHIEGIGHDISGH